MSKSSATQSTNSQPTVTNLNDRAVRGLADAIFKHLQDEGCKAKDIINVSSQLLGLVTDQIREDRPVQ